MALDTKNKRGSTINISMPFRTWIAEPSTVDTGFRLSVLHFSSSIYEYEIAELFWRVWTYKITKNSFTIRIALSEDSYAIIEDLSFNYGTGWSAINYWEDGAGTINDIDKSSYTYHGLIETSTNPIYLYEIEVTGLSPETQYYFRARKNITGYSLPQHAALETFIGWEGSGRPPSNLIGKVTTLQTSDNTTFYPHYLYFDGSGMFQYTNVVFT